jgi:hypothetical protein
VVISAKIASLSAEFFKLPFGRVLKEMRGVQVWRLKTALIVACLAA